MAKIFTYRGKTFDEIKKLSLGEFAEMLPARSRRTIKRGFTESQKKFLDTLKKEKKDLKTHCRDMIVIPDMVGRTLKIHNGKEFTIVKIAEDMLGHRLGEFTQTRKKVSHSAPGIGATRSSASLSVR